MADEVERVEYVFEGDVTSLRSASQAAINMLGKYSDTMKRVSNTSAFTASQRAATAMNASISRLTKDVTRLQTKLRSVQDIKLPDTSASAKVMETTLKTVHAQLTKLSSESSISGRTVSQFKAQLDGVRASLQSVAPQVDRLVAKEQRHQQVLQTVNGVTTRFKNTMSGMQTRLASTFEPITSRLRTFSSVFDGVDSKMQSFKAKAVSAFTTVRKRVSSCAEAFRRNTQASEEASSIASTTSSSHRRLSDVFTDIAARIRHETAAINGEKDSLRSKDAVVRQSSDSHGIFSRVLNKLGSVFSTETKKAKDYFNSIGSASSIMPKVISSITALAGIQLGRWFIKSAQGAIDYVENLNLFTVAMGDAVEEGTRFVQRMQEIYGMDPSNLYNYTGYFYQLSDAIGLTEKASASMSLSLTKAANDVASLFNVDISKAVENLASGMQGQTKAVRKYGIDIRVATLQQTAFQYGITESVTNMSEANRMALRYLTMMQQVSKALKQAGTDADGASATLGDFANNIETPSNQLRILKEQLAQLGRAIGNFVVAPLSRAIAYINGFVMALRMAINFLASFLSILNIGSGSVDTGGLGDAESSLDDVADAAAGAGSAIQDLIAPFDELNVLQESSGGGGSGALDDVLDPALAKAIEDMQLDLENIRMKANDVRDALLKMFGFIVEDGNITGWDADTFWSSLGDLDTNAKELAEKIAEKLNKAIEKLPAADLGDAIGKFINAGLEAVVSFEYSLDFKQLGSKIAEFVTNGLKNVNFYNLGRQSVVGIKILSDLITGILDNLDQPIDEYASGWDMLGDKIADWVEGAIESIPWKDLGVNITRIAAGIYKLIIRILAKVSWEDIGEDIAEFINGIDFAEIFRNLLHIAAEVGKALVSAFSGLWENADPDTKAIIAATGLALLYKFLKPVIARVASLTTGFDKKNESLKQQNELEATAATQLSTGLIPQLGFAFAALAPLVTIFGDLNGELGTNNGLVGDNTLAEESLTTAAQGLATATDTLSTSVTDATTALQESLTTVAATSEAIASATTPVTEYAQSIANVGTAAVNSSLQAVTSVGVINTATSALDPTPAQNYASAVSNAFGAIATAVGSAATAVYNYKLQLSELTGEEVAAGTASIIPSLNASLGKTLTFKPLPATTAAGMASIAERGAAAAAASSSTNTTPTYDSVDMALAKASSQFDAIRQILQAAFGGSTAGSSVGAVGSLSGVGSASGLGAAGSLWLSLLPLLAFASGGVVTSPTYALIGEGKYDEAVIPLGDSPQMNELVQRIADAVDKPNDSDTPVNVRVFIGGDEYDAFTYKAAKRGEKKVGAQPLEVHS